MIRKAEDKDVGAIVAFLRRHSETSMFLLGNLEAHGLNNTEHANGTAYFLRETGEGITGVFGATNGGYLMCQLPGIGATEAQTYAHLLQGYTLRGMTGDVAQVDAILAALPVPGDAWHVNRAEPLYARDLAGIKSKATLIRPAEDHRALLTEWFGQYAADAGLSDGCNLALNAANAGIAIASGRVRLLLDGGVPVAMTGINVRAGVTVQVGGVFVARDRRGEGLAGQIVAAHLQELRGEGVARAILFTASAQAARAYEKIGFNQIGSYRLALLKEPLTLGVPR